MDVQFVDFHDISVPIWNTFVDSCDECWAYHKAEYIQADIANSHSFAILEGGKMCGVCVLYSGRERFGRILRGPGLSLDNSVSKKKLYPIIKDYLKSLANRNRCCAIQFSFPILAPAFSRLGFLNSHLLNLGFSSSLRWGYGIHYLPSYTNVLDLRGTVEDIFSGFSKGHKWDCHKCEKMTPSYEYHDGHLEDRLWNDYISIHLETYERTGTKPFSREYLNRLRSFIERGLMALGNLYIGTECIASVLLVTYKKRAFYLAGGIRENKEIRHCGTYIHLLTIKELKNRGYEYYELGQSYPSIKESKMGKIGEFKGTFGGEKWPILAGELVVNELAYLLRIIFPNSARRILQIEKAKWGRKS
jgi:hypothetical protein